MKKRVFQVSLAMTLVCMSSPVAVSQAPQSVAGPEISPGLSMTEAEAWIKRELPAMGLVQVVESDGQSRTGNKYQIQVAVLSECRLTLRLARDMELTGPATAQVRFITVYTVPLKDVDTSRLRATEAPVLPGSSASRPSYIVSLSALRSSGAAFTRESSQASVQTGRVLSASPKSTAAQASVRVGDQKMGDQASEVFRRAAVLCGAPNQPVVTALAKTTPETPSSAVLANPASPNGNSVSLPQYTAGTVVTTSSRQAKAGDLDLTPTGVSLRLPSTYMNAQAPADQLQLNADNTFSLQEAGQPYHGTFVANGNSVELNISDGPKTTATIQGSNLIDSSGQTWVLREQSSGTAPSGSPLPNEDAISVAASTPATSGSTRSSAGTSLADLQDTIQAGKEVSFPVKYNAFFESAIPGPVLLVDGLVTLSKTTFGFKVTAGYKESFAISPDKILTIVKEPQQASRLHVLVAIKNKKGTKDDKKDYYFYSVGARAAGGGPDGEGASINCDDCDDSMNVLYGLLKEIRAQ